MTTRSRRVRTILYDGPLTPKLAGAGSAAAIRTAVSLLGDARILARNGRWARAFALAQMAVEEVGKPMELRRVLLARSKKDIEKAWRTGYRGHKSKAERHEGPIDRREHLDPSSITARMDRLKVLALYSDATGKTCRWKTPGGLRYKPLALLTIGMASRWIRDHKNDASLTAGFLEIWTRRILPTVGGPAETRLVEEGHVWLEAAEQGLVTRRKALKEVHRLGITPGRHHAHLSGARSNGQGGDSLPDKP